MRILVLLLLLGLRSIESWGQSKMEQPMNVHIRAEQAPLILVDSLPAEMNGLLLGADKIESINVFKDDMAIARFGERGRNGVIYIHTKPHTTLLRLNDILDRFNVSAPDRKLRVTINSVLIKNPEMILSAPGDIESVEIVTGCSTEDLKTAFSDERFLNIKAKGSLNK